ncbi:hypothetical protein MMO38_16025 [Acinetobacter sp. NIPH 1852]|uniref:hypothetical protein n=1 Tax=Acinetobacter sp. NIPH 1852 TaxID=2923428 RepID=UPI001F4A281E|nr:hypothetical protein [Acinetobacter sp. NIPH 1852]MCH7309624.1 hypothetical protein [Acinetobacter sp. NIPH 1852]
MNKLDLCPLQSSYSVKYGTSVERIALRGGFGRYIQTKNAKKHLVDVAFTLREDDFTYFRAFYLNWQLNPLPFLMPLIIEDSAFREYIAQFVPDSFSFNELSGKIFKVSVQLVVVTSEVQILTSKPYPTYLLESIAYHIPQLGAQQVNNYVDMGIEAGNYSLGIAEVSSREVLNKYSYVEDSSYSIGVQGVQITKQTSYLTYAAPDIEASDYSVGVHDVQITKTVAYIPYTSDTESSDYSISIHGVQITN